MPQSKATQRECPFCEETVDSRGLYAHVMHSTDEDHKEGGSVPEGFNPREAPIVTEDDETIEVDLDDEYPNRIFMCHHCGNMSKGRRGHAIHLSKSAGDELHPEGASISDENYTIIPADDDWNPIVDETELSQLHDEIIPDQGKLDTREGGIGRPSDAELQELIDQAVIPRKDSKVEQVATLLNQVPELYDRPEAVKETINCSTTTFYEGRKMFDNSSAPEMETVRGDKVDRVEEIAWQADDDAVVIGGEQYVPISAVAEIVRKVNEASASLNEVTTEGARLVHKAR